MRKNWRGGGELLLKMIQSMFALTNHVIYGPDLYDAGPRALGDFCNIFLPNIGEEQKNNLIPSERGAPALCRLVNPALVIALRS